MARNAKNSLRDGDAVVEVKSKFDAEFRRFSIDKTSLTQFEDFYDIVEALHLLKGVPFLLCYIDPKDQDLLPINNDDNYQKAVSTSRPLLKLIVQKKGESWGEMYGYGSGTLKKKGPISKLIAGEVKLIQPRIAISLPEDFRRVSAIIDVDIVPEAHRRVKLMKNGSDKPLGFYIRDGTSVRVTPQGLEKVPGIFISRLVPGGLAESTGLLAVNDEVLEVNGIEVAGKTLDQVTDMMVANSSNLIITVKPVNQRNTLPARGDVGRGSQMSGKSSSSYRSAMSGDSDEIRTHDLDEVDDDEIRDHVTSGERETSGDSPEPEQKDKDKDSAVVTL